MRPVNIKGQTGLQLGKRMGKTRGRFDGPSDAKLGRISALHRE